MTIVVFRTIPAARVFEIAKAAALRNSVALAEGNELTPTQKLDFLLFSLAICEALHGIDYNPDHLGLEEVVDIAKKTANFEEYDMYADKSGLVDQKKLIRSSQDQAFFIQMAFAIAAYFQHSPDRLPGGPCGVISE